MKQVTHTQAFLRKRKMLMVLPLLALPFMTLAFWALGGGRTDRNTIDSAQGLNLELPSAQLKEDSTLTKLSFYEMARSDSQKRREWMRSDPYYRQLDTALSWRSSERDLEPSLVNATSDAGYDHSPLKPTPNDAGTVSAEEKVMQKLSQLNQVIQSGGAESHEKAKANTVGSVPVNPNFSADINRLEAMMQQAGSSAEEDPELRQLSSMMDRILDIQHPQRVKERIKEASLMQKEAVYPVQAEGATLSISLLGNDIVKRRPLGDSSRFYGLEDNPQSDAQNAVLSAIHGTQTLTSGSVVKLRLEQNIYVGGEPIPKGAFIYGTAEIGRERLHISISTIRSGITILPVKLRVYDLDGIEGIYMPGSVQREVAKYTTDNALQSLELSTLDPTLKAKAASAGISAARNLLSRKVKVEKVTLKGGYQVILQSL